MRGSLGGFWLCLQDNSLNGVNNAPTVHTGIKVVKLLWGVWYLWKRNVRMCLFESVVPLQSMTLTRIVLQQTGRSLLRRLFFVLRATVACSLKTLVKNKTCQLTPNSNHSGLVVRVPDSVGSPAEVGVRDGHVDTQYRQEPLCRQHRAAHVSSGPLDCGSRVSSDVAFQSYVHAFKYFQTASHEDSWWNW